MSETTVMDDRTGEIGSPSDDPKNLLRQAREMIPVGPAGIHITDLAQQIDYAQTMAKARMALPAHLRQNVGDCLAIIDISSRAGLSPYMVASKTYVQNDKLCFESQLFHAFAQASGLLKGDLEVSWEGEGGDRVCVITGVLRKDPTKPRVHRSPALKDLHPGYSLKRQMDEGGTAKKTISYVDGQKLKADGKIGESEQLFSKGSPLWDRKPDVQMFYDTSRDWVRMFIPQATLGIYSGDEFTEYGPEAARDVTPPGIGSRLAGTEVSREEGLRAGHVESELEQVGGGPREIKTDSAAQAETKAAPTDGKPARKSRKKAAGEAEKLAGEATPESAKDTTLPKEAATAPETASPAPKNVREWVVYNKAWLKAETSHEAIRKRWNDERALRNSCGVTSDERVEVQNIMVDRCKELGEDQS